MTSAIYGSVRTCCVHGIREAHLKKLEHRLCDAHALLDQRIRKVYQCVRRRILRRLHRFRLALLAHLGRLVAVLRVDLVPLLDPVVRRLRGLYGSPSWDIFLMTAGYELEQFDLLLAVEMGANCAGCDKLERKDVSVDHAVGITMCLRENRFRTSTPDSSWCSQSNGHPQAADGLLSPSPLSTACF